LWEGYDEWSHFAVVQRMAFRGEPLVFRDSPISRDVAASLELAPVAWECRSLPPPSATYDDFWRLPPAERARRESEFRAIPSAWAAEDSTGPLKSYEGLQSPLAAWMMSPVLLAARHAHLSTQVLLLRWYSMAILSLVIPLTFLTARSVFRHDATALGCAAVVAAMPGFLIGIARVSNEYLGGAVQPPALAFGGRTHPAPPGRARHRRLVVRAQSAHHRHAFGYAGICHAAHRHYRRPTPSGHPYPLAGHHRFHPVFPPLAGRLEHPHRAQLDVPPVLPADRSRHTRTRLSLVHGRHSHSGRIRPRLLAGPALSRR